MLRSYVKSFQSRQYKALLWMSGFLWMISGVQAQHATTEELDRLADSAYEKYYHQAAVDHKGIDSLLFQYPTDVMTEGKEKLYRILASYYHNLGRPNIAYPYLKMIANSAEQRGDSARLGLVLAGIGESHRSFGEFEKARRILDRAVRLCEDFGDDVSRAYAHGRLGATLFELDKSDSAQCLPSLRKALQYVRRTNQVHEEGAILGDYAAVLMESGEHQNAIDMLHKALAIIDNPKVTCHLNNTLAGAFLKQNALDSSLWYARLAYDFAIEQELFVYATTASHLIEQSFFKAGKIDSAYRWLEVNKECHLKWHKTRVLEDARVLNIEADRQRQRIENEFLRERQKEQDASLNKFRWTTFFGALLLVVLFAFTVRLAVQQKRLRDAQAALRDSHRQIAEKNEELTKFLNVRDRLISVASHDLRAPLATVKEILSLLKETTLSPEEMRQMVTLMEGQYQRSLDMADNLLMWVKTQLKGIEANKTRIELVELTDEVVLLSQPIMQSANVRVRFQHDRPVYVMADLEMVRFIFRNLLHNAIKFSRKGQEVELTIAESEGYITWCCRDSGPGMSEEQVHELFRMGSRLDAKDPKKGAGIGLFLCNMFAELNNGRLNVESVKGTGSAFCLELIKE